MCIRDSSQAPACSPGCDEMRLGNTVCDIACNTTECVWDQGDCGYYGEYELEDLCSAGCPLSWLGDGFCDEACYNLACSWDQDDCISAGAGCADACLPSFIDDRECDEACNNEACGFDGTDCDADADECYEQARARRKCGGVGGGLWRCRFLGLSLNPGMRNLLGYAVALRRCIVDAVAVRTVCMENG
eukprot:6197629-Pleurochrysis_carterae.AAC.1